MPVFGVKEWKKHLRVLRLGTISKIQRDYQNCPGMKLRFCLKRFTEVAYELSFYPRGSNLSLFSLYGQRFPRYGPMLKNTIFEHETEWILKKGTEVAYGPSWTFILPHGVEIEPFFALRAAVYEIQADFDNYHIWA